MAFKSKTPRYTGSTNRSGAKRTTMGGNLPRAKSNPLNQSSKKRPLKLRGRSR